MKLLMFGASGQVAQEVLRRAGGVEIEALERIDVDLTDPETCAAVIARTDADAVLNAAAYTAVDLAEENEKTAAIINGAAPAMMADAARKRDLPFIHISSDYIFDGSGEAPKRETDTAGPLSSYGWSKLAGERGVEAAGGRFVILRTSWVFSAHGSNFVKTMLRLGAEREALNIVADQIGGPTPAAAIADACLHVASALSRGEGTPGIYHFAGAPDISWRGFAEAIFAMADMDVTVTPIPTSDYPTPAERPLNSRLDCARIGEIFGILRPDWRMGLRDVLREITPETGQELST